MADIRKRASGGYQVRFKADGGKTRYRTFKRRVDATAFIQSLSTWRDGAADHSVAEVVERWIDAAEHTGISGRPPVTPRTLVNYQRYARAMIDYDWPSSIEDLDRAAVATFRDHLLQTETRFIARKILRAFHGVLNYARDGGIIAANVAEGVTIRMSSRERRRTQIPTTDQVRAIMAAIEDRIGGQPAHKRRLWMRHRAAFALMVLAGMRPSEVFGLTWRAVSADTIRVVQSCDPQGRLAAPKSAASRRDIRVAGRLVEILDAWRAVSAFTKPADLVIATQNGGPVRQVNFRGGAFLPIMRDVGLMRDDDPSKPRFTVYALRHYFASKLIDRGANIKYVQAQMGHETVEVTLDVYGHLLDDSAAGIADDMEAIAAEIF